MGTSYDYRVRAVNGSGMGPWSTSNSGTAAALPSAVTMVNIEIISATGSLVVTWTPANGNGNLVTHYNVRYARNVQGTEAWRSKRVTASALPTTVITGLSAGPHIIGITAVNPVGSSDETMTAGHYSPGFALAAPSSVTAVPSTIGNVAGNMIDVTWSAVANAVGYQVEYLVAVSSDQLSLGNPASPWSILDPVSVMGATVKVVGLDTVNTFDAAAARKATIGDLTEGATYVVRVRAVTQGQVSGEPAGDALPGTPGFSAPVKAEGSPSTPPADVDVVQPEKTTTLKVTWNPSDNARAEEVTGYLVTWYPTLTSVTGNRGNATVAADAKSYDITGLTAIGREITVVVSAVNEIGVGAAATAVTAKLTPPTT